MNIPADEMVYPPESVNWEYDPLCADCIKARNWKRFSDIESAFEDYGMAVEGIACRAVWAEPETESSREVLLRLLTEVVTSKAVFSEFTEDIRRSGEYADWKVNSKPGWLHRQWLRQQIERIGGDDIQARGADLAASVSGSGRITEDHVSAERTRLTAGGIEAERVRASALFYFVDRLWQSESDNGLSELTLDKPLIDPIVCREKERQAKKMEAVERDSERGAETDKWLAEGLALIESKKAENWDAYWRWVERVTRHT